MSRNSDIPKRPPSERSALKPPQFSLSTLLWVIAGLAGLFGLMTAAGPLGGFALLLLVLVIVAHVAGNSLGTRLRSFGSERVEDDHPQRKAAVTTDPRQAAAPASNLSLRGKVSLAMLVFTIAGAAIFGALGTTTLIWLTWNQLNLATAIVAIVSPAVLGGWIGFAISSFTQTAGGAWREASGAYQREKLQRTQGTSNVTFPTSPPTMATSLHAQSPDHG